MTDAFERTAEKMKAHGLSETAIAQFEHLYDVWQHEDGTTWIREEDIEPVQDIPNFAQIYETINHDKAVDAFAKTAFLKLNGGLGTSMGLDCANHCCRFAGTKPSKCASSTSFSDRWKPHATDWAWSSR